jgi:hypothetical protein
MHSPIPTLPPELEKAIFEIAVRDSNRTRKIWDLQLVAHRIGAWLRPVLFESIFIETNQNARKIIELLNGNSPGLAEYVKHLFLDDDCSEECIIRLVSMCKGIITLSTSTSIPYEAVADHLFERLSIMDAFDGGASLALPVYSRITHLEVFSRDGCYNMEFSLLPSLTHLAFTGRSWIPLSFVPMPPERRFLQVMDTCPRLEMLLLLAEERHVERVVNFLRSIGSHRLFVWGYQSFKSDWEDHIVGDDIWQKAKRNSDTSAVLPQL